MDVIKLHVHMEKNNFKLNTFLLQYEHKQNGPNKKTQFCSILFLQRFSIAMIPSL